MDHLKSSFTINDYIFDSNSFKSGLVYLVDDDNSILELLEDLISISGLKIKKFNNAKVALDNINIDRPDVIITDINMPKLNGLKFHEICKNQGLFIPFIFLSGYTNEETLHHCVKFNAFAAMEKPFISNDLIVTCLRAVEEHRTQKLLEKSLNTILYQFADLDNVLRYHNCDDIRNSLKFEIENIMHLKKKLNSLKIPSNPQSV